jgi:membrane associated rhomboid family serine protease
MKPRATFVLIAINIAAYLWELSTGAPDSSRALYADGALCKLCVTEDHEYWRIVTSAFLHGGLSHIALNMFALLQIGGFLESLIGSRRMLAIYVVAMLGGGFAVVAFGGSTGLTIGASGAIFGLFGALIAIGLRMGSRGKALISQTAPIIVINLIFTFAIPFISKEAHIGGLISGFIAGFILAMGVRERQPVVTDTQTGETTEAEYIAPGDPNGPPHLTGVP